MRWERFAKNCAFSVILFLLVNVLQVIRLPGTEIVRDYLAFAFTTEWDYHGPLEQARSGIRTLASYTGRFGKPLPEPEAAPPADRPAGPAPDRDAPLTPPSPSAGEASAPGGGERLPQLQWPVRGRLSAGFGRRNHPVYRLMGVHEGIDVGAPEGTPVVAAAAGRVTATFRGLSSGLTVDLDHGGFTTRYAHLSAIKVRTGETVKAGTVIGLVGNTGVSTGPHLHFEVRRNGQPVDPLPLLPR
ncbi:MAG: M23 family metallopeptidase [Bacillota bacterium]|nr:M23 family metallopeptidase [Bacillota bacterium]